MIRISKTHRARGLIPYAATILSLTLAATLKIERSCSAESFRVPAAPEVMYPYPEMVAGPAEKSAFIETTRSASHRLEECRSLLPQRTFGNARQRPSPCSAGSMTGSKGE